MHPEKLRRRIPRPCLKTHPQKSSMLEQVLTESELPESYENIRKRLNPGPAALLSNLEPFVDLALSALQETCLFIQWTLIGAGLETIKVVKTRGAGHIKTI